MARIDDRLTPVTPNEVFLALESAWKKELNESPHRTSLLVLLSQWALETGRGRSMHCYNLGNVKSKGESGDWCFFRCNEIIDGKTVWFDPDHPGCRFRAFQTLDDGALDYLRTLHKRFQRAWPAVQAGDPAAFVHDLKLQRYFTADEGQYTRTLVSLFNEFSRSIPIQGLPTPAPLPDLYSIAGLQTALTKLGFDPGPIDGDNGPHTQAATIEFQRSKGLVQDGVVGRLTREALVAAWRETNPV